MHWNELIITIKRMRWEREGSERWIRREEDKREDDVPFPISKFCFFGARFAGKISETRSVMPCPTSSSRSFVFQKEVLYSKRSEEGRRNLFD